MLDDGICFVYQRGMFAIFEKLGGREAAFKELRAKTHRPAYPSKATEKLWRKNKELPGPVIKILIPICDERRIAYSMDDFRAPSKEPRR